MIDWRILLNGTDISSKVASFTVTCDAASYCRQLSMAIADTDLYAGFDFLTLPDAPTVDVYVYSGAPPSPVFPDDYTRLGSFFVERPGISHTPNASLVNEVWGRSKTALLGSPFAAKITQTWSTDTSFYAICEEMCDLCGITWDPAYSTIEDFFIFAGTYSAENLYPVDIITELARFAAGDGIFITTDGNDHLCVFPIDYTPATGSEVFTIADSDLVELSESVEWPDFGNRIKISATGSTSGWKVTLSVPNQCLSADGAVRAKMYAQVVDQDDAPLNDIPVNWSLSRDLVTLDAATTNTQTLVISEEAQRAKSYYEVDVTFPPTSVTGVWSARDTRKETNLVASGYELDGNTIILPQELTYCDQSLIVTYTAAGMALNWATAGTSPGTEKVTADVGGNDDMQELYIDNPCACPPDLTLHASPSSIKIGESSLIVAYLEIAGAPVTEGRAIWMTIDSSPSRGHLGWTKNNLGRVTVSNERTSAVNEVAGFTQCELAMFPDSVSSVYASDTEGNAVGDNLYSSHSGKVVTLNTEIASDTDLIANYVTVGAIVNDYEGIEVGEDRIRALISTTREERTEATCRITVTDEENSDGSPEDCCDDGQDSDRGSDTPGGNDDEFDWLPETKPEPRVVHCLGANGQVISCQPGQVCCQKGGVWGCYAWNECDQTPDTCYPVNCRENPSADCLGARFTKALADNAAFGCSCEELCSKEFDAYGTTQNYDGASMRSVAEIVVSSYGHALGTPQFWEKFEELKTDALGSCREQCGDCASVGALTITGDDTAIAPGGQVMSAAGGMLPYTWSVEGTGVAVGQDGTVTVGADGCGSHVVTVTDRCGATATKTVRVTNNGQWVPVSPPGGTHWLVGYWCDVSGTVYVGFPCSVHCTYEEVVSGKYKINVRTWPLTYSANSWNPGFPPVMSVMPGSAFGPCTQTLDHTVDLSDMGDEWVGLYRAYYNTVTVDGVWEWTC